MKHERLVKEIEKLGFSVDQSKWNENHYFSTGNKYVVSWYKDDEIANCVHIVSKKQEGERDSQSDYFPGFFASTYKEVKYYLKEVR